nr:hypothetical protein [Streptomyces sp. XY413]
MVVAVVGEGVEVGVGGGVVGLAGVADEAGDGGEEDEVGEVVVPGQFVEVPGGVGLGAEDPGEVAGGEVVEGGVVEGAGGVDDRGEGVVRGDGAEQVLQRGAVGGVAGGDGDVGAGRGEFVGEFPGPGGVGSAAAGQEQGGWSGAGVGRRGG